MTEPPAEDLAARGRSIFRRLREPERDVRPDADGENQSGSVGDGDAPVAPDAQDAVPTTTDTPSTEERATEPSLAPKPRNEAPFDAVVVDHAWEEETALRDDHDVSTSRRGDGRARNESQSPEGATPPVHHRLPRVIAVANQKGGVGKTTTSVNLGACLAELGHRTLVVDLDPQGNASTGLGINIRSLESSMYDVLLHDVPMEDCIEAASVRNLFVAPAALDLAGAEIELVPAFSREMRLKQAIDSIREDYDYVLIDCPPSLGLLTVNGFAAADEVLVPIQCEYYALEGLGQLLRNVQLVQKNLNAKLDVSTIVMVMYDARTKLSDQVVHEVREHFGDKVCRTVVPRTVRLSEAPSFGQPIVAFDPSSRGAIAYRELAKEVSSAS